MKWLSEIFVLLGIGFSHFSGAQNQYSKWYFGTYAALDFLSDPPIPLLNSGMNSYWQCISQSDDSGNLLFYSNGVTVYDKTHAVMTNGNGLYAYGPGQNCIVVRKPGSKTIYFIFTLREFTPPGLYYSVIDMSLSAGNGSVVAKNIQLDSPFLFEQKISGTQHCNGTDFWILTKQYNSPNFRGYLISATGVATTAVVSSVGHSYPTTAGPIKIAPSGSKLASISGTNHSQQQVTLYDFDNSTGLVSAPITLHDSVRQSIGLEFSPDCSKLYSGENPVTAPGTFLYQWDICSGSPVAIRNSVYLMPGPRLGALQLGVNNKIYGAVFSSANIAVVNNPDAKGFACNYSSAGQTLGGKGSGPGLPNFITSYKVKPPAFSTYLNPSLGCRTMSFTANLPAISCGASNFTVNNMLWDFGDTVSGSKNNSSAFNPQHVFSSSGTFYVKLILYYKCTSDTIVQTVNIPPPDISVAVTPDCSNSASATAIATGGVGPYTYTWMPSLQTGTVVNGLAPGVQSIAVTDHGQTCSVVEQFTVVTRSAPVFNILPPGTQTVCAGSTLSVALSNTVPAYSWLPAEGVTASGTRASLSPSTSQLYTITATDNTCTATETLMVVVNPLPQPEIKVGTTACENSKVEVSGNGGVKYVWAIPGGFVAHTPVIKVTAIEPVATEPITLTVTDSGGCVNSATHQLSVNPAPTIPALLTPEGCAPFCITFRQSTLNIPPHTKLYWSSGNSTQGNDSTCCFQIPGTYPVIWKLLDTISGCSGNYTFTVKARPRPTADFSYFPEKNIENSGETIFSAKSKTDSLQTLSWIVHQSATNQVFKRQGEEFSHYFSEAGSYIVVLLVENAWRCSDTAIKHLVIQEDFAVYIPNAFTPNDDDRNTLFLPVTRGVYKYQCEIYNRWGVKIFESHNAAEGWDGTVKGVQAPTGAYVYIIHIVSGKGETKKYTGEVVLLR